MADRVGDRLPRDPEELLLDRRRRPPRSARDELERRARAEQNLLPAILAAVESFATVGEISDTLRQVFGEYQESVIL